MFKNMAAIGLLALYPHLIEVEPKLAGEILLKSQWNIECLAIQPGAKLRDLIEKFQDEDEAMEFIVLYIGATLKTSSVGCTVS